jgi:hypothetical protein
MLALMRARQWLRPGRGAPPSRAWRRIALVSYLLVATLAAACSQPQAYGPPAPSRVGYERLQQAYAVWQLVDRARDATAQLKSWRELDPETGSSWDYAIPNLTHYRFFAMDGRFHEGYESDETDCWLRDDGRWDHRPIGRRPPVAAALSDDLFGGAVRIVAESATEIDGEAVQVVRFSQRAGDRRWSTLAQDREVRVWLAVDDALPRRVEVAAPTLTTPERTSVRVLTHFDEPLDVDSPCT